MAFQLPSRGFVFWPVGTGDSTTIVVNKQTVLQVDLHHMIQSEEDDTPHIPIIDYLVELLPKVDGKPYLSVFALSHPDQDHCRGFADLLKRVRIGELWFTPRIFKEYKKDLCPDAKVFCEEATRRVKKMIDQGGLVKSGDLVRIIGYGDWLRENKYDGFPSDRLTVPGNTITSLDGRDCSSLFRAFVHAPFKDDGSAERNETSLGFQVSLIGEKTAGHALLFGDLSYPVLKRIFKISDAANLIWNVLLSPHHCSKSAMYWKEEGEQEESFKKDIMEAMEKAAGSPGYIVSSSAAIPASNNSGDNPPHAKAKRRYEEIVPDEFLCTQEHPNEKEPVPIIFAIEEGGLVYIKPESAEKKKVETSLAAAVIKARGSNEPPKDRVGFGRRND